MKKHIGKILNEISELEGLSQVKLSKEANISYPQLNSFLNGKSNLTLENFVSLLEILNIDIHSLLQEKINRHYPQATHTVQTSKDCLLYLYDKLDVVRQQAMIKSAHSAVLLANKKIPANVELVIKNSTQLL